MYFIEIERRYTTVQGYNGLEDAIIEVSILSKTKIYV